MQKYLRVDIYENKQQENGLAKNELCILADYVPGGSIKNILENFKSFKEKMIGIYMKQVLNGVKSLHRVGIIHQDIKLSNILIDEQGLIKLTDIGDMKKIADPTMDGIIYGSERYTAPEIAAGQAVTEQADIWQLGCATLEMLTGMKPWFNFEDDQSEELMEYLKEMFEKNDTDKLPKFPVQISYDCLDFL